MLTFWPLPPFYYWVSSDVLKSLSPEIWWCHLWMDPQHKKLMQKVLMASSRNCRKENIKVPDVSLIPIRALHPKSVWVDLSHLSTAVAWRGKKSKHFVFYKYFCLILGLLKSRILKKSLELLLRKSDFKLFHYKARVQPVSKITTIATRNRC